MHRFPTWTTFFALIFSLAACGGGGGGGGSSVSPPGGGGGAPPPVLPASVTPSSGATIGADDLFSPTDGDAPSGGNGQTVDGIPCTPTMAEANYHIHVFVGIVANGKMVALPDGMGMKNPGADSGGVTSTATCFYYLHTHDAAGIVHIEDPSTASRTTALHTFGQFLDIWGQPFSSSGLGPFSGSVKIYTSGAQYRGQGPQTVANSTYALYGGDPRAMKLYAHEVIWIEIGPAFVSPQALPSVNFGY